jgi:enoyl-CoA hydratase/carnithine racemase
MSAAMVRLAEDWRGEELIAEITIDRPGKLNVIGQAAMLDLRALCDDLAGRPELRCVVLRGGGDKAFIGGADIAEMAALDPASARRFITALHEVCAGLRALPVPVIARIAGYALGAGLEIAAACDLRIAASTARFGMPEVKVGIPSVIEAALLPRLVGDGRARAMMLLGEVFTAEEAERWGLLSRVVAPESLESAVAEAITAVLATGREALRLQKALFQRWENLPLEAAIAAGIDAFAQAFEGPEPRQRLGAFVAAKQSAGKTGD